jgi:hypothetical protein
MDLNDLVRASMTDGQVERMTSWWIRRRRNMRRIVVVLVFFLCFLTPAAGVAGEEMNKRTLGELRNSIPGPESGAFWMGVGVGATQAFVAVGFSCPVKISAGELGAYLRYTATSNLTLNEAIKEFMANRRCSQG